MIILTDSAQSAVRGFIERDDSLRGRSLRIFVEGGGCSGFQYGFTFSDRKEDDSVLACGGFDVVVDPMSLPYLSDSVVDWVDGLQGTGFTVKNPNATGGCGCGKSFSA